MYSITLLHAHHQKFIFHLSTYTWPSLIISLPPGPFWWPVTCYLYLRVFLLGLAIYSFLYSTYGWNHGMFVFSAWLISLRMIPSRSIHAVANSKISSVLWLTFPHMYTYHYATSSLSTHLLMGTESFHILVIINNVMNIRAHISFWSSVFVFFG